MWGGLWWRAYGVASPCVWGYTGFISYQHRKSPEGRRIGEHPTHVGDFQPILGGAAHSRSLTDCVTSALGDAVEDFDVEVLDAVREVLDEWVPTVITRTEVQSSE